MLSNNYNILEERYLEIKNTIEYKYSDPRMVVNNKGRIKERWLEYRIGNSLVDKDDLPEGYENFNLRLDFLGAVKKNGFNIIEGDFLTQSVKKILQCLIVLRHGFTVFN